MPPPPWGLTDRYVGGGHDKICCSVCHIRRYIFSAQCDYATVNGFVYLYEFPRHRIFREPKTEAVRNAVHLSPAALFDHRVCDHTNTPLCARCWEAKLLAPPVGIFWYLYILLFLSGQRKAALSLSRSDWPLMRPSSRFILDKAASLGIMKIERALRQAVSPRLYYHEIAVSLAGAAILLL